MTIDTTPAAGGTEQLTAQIRDVNDKVNHAAEQFTLAFARYDQIIALLKTNCDYWKGQAEELEKDRDHWKESYERVLSEQEAEHMERNLRDFD